MGASAPQTAQLSEACSGPILGPSALRPLVSGIPRCLGHANPSVVGPTQQDVVTQRVWPQPTGRCCSSSSSGNLSSVPREGAEQSSRNGCGACCGASRSLWSPPGYPRHCLNKLHLITQNIIYEHWID